MDALVPKLLTLAAAALLGAGLVLGLLPISAYGENCGSAFSPSDDADIADIGDTLLGNTPRTGVIGGVAAACEDKRGGRQTGAAVLLVLGAVAGVGAVTVRRRQEPTAGTGSDDSRNIDTPR